MNDNDQTQPYMSVHQLLTTLESGLDAWEKHQEAIAESRPLPRTRQPIAPDVDESFSIAISLATKFAFKTSENVASLLGEFGCSAVDISDWANKRNLPVEINLRLNILRKICDGLRTQRNWLMK